MASQQQMRRDSLSNVDKDHVHKITSQLESLNDTAKSHHHAPPSLEETRALRATAQQNSIDAIAAAENQYHKAKEGDTAHVGGNSNSTSLMDQAAVAGWGAAQYTMEKVAGATKTIADATSNAPLYTSEKAAAAAAAKDKAVTGDMGAEETGDGVWEAIGEMLSEIGHTTKDMIAGIGKTQYHDPREYESKEQVEQ